MGYLLPFDMNRGGETASMRTPSTGLPPLGGAVAAVHKGGGSKGGKGYFRMITKGKYKGQVLFCYGTYQDINKQLFAKQQIEKESVDKEVFGEFVAELANGADQNQNISGTGPLEDQSPKQVNPTDPATYDIFGHSIQVYANGGEIASTVEGTATPRVANGDVAAHLAQLLHAAHGFTDSQGTATSSRGVTTTGGEVQNHVPTWNQAGDGHEISPEFSSVLLRLIQESMINEGIVESRETLDAITELTKRIFQQFPKTDRDKDVSFGLNEVRPITFDHTNSDGSTVKRTSAEEDNGSIAATIAARRGFDIQPSMGEVHNDRETVVDPHALPVETLPDGSVDDFTADSLFNEEDSLSTRVDRVAQIIASRWVQILGEYREKPDTNALSQEFTDPKGVVAHMIGQSHMYTSELRYPSVAGYVLNKDNGVIRKESPAGALDPNIVAKQTPTERLITVKAVNSVAHAMGITGDNVIPHLIDILAIVLGAGTREITTEVPNPQYALKPPRVKPLSARRGGRLNLKISPTGPAGPSSFPASPVGYSATVWNDPRAESVNPLHRDTHTTPYLKKETKQESYGNTDFYQAYLESAGLLPDSADAVLGGTYGRPPNIAAPNFFDALLLYRLTPDSSSIQLSSHGGNGITWQDISELGANDQQRLMIGLKAKSGLDYEKWKSENPNLAQYADPWREIYHEGGLIDQLTRVVALVNDRKADFARKNAGQPLLFTSQTAGFTPEQIEQLRSDKVGSTGFSIREKAEGLLTKISALITGSDHENIKIAQKAIIGRLSLASNGINNNDAEDYSDGIDSRMAVGSFPNQEKVSKWMLGNNFVEGNLTNPNALSVKDKTDVSQWNMNYIQGIRKINRGFNLGTVGAGGSGGFVSEDLSGVSTDLSFSLADVAEVILGKKVPFDDISKTRKNSHANPLNVHGALRKIHDGTLKWFAENAGKMPMEEFIKLITGQQRDLFGPQEIDVQTSIHSIISEAVSIAQECQRTGISIIPISSLRSFIPELAEVVSDPNVKIESSTEGGKASSSIPFCVYVKGNPEWMHLQNRIAFFEDPIVNTEALQETLEKYLPDASGISKQSAYSKDESGKPEFRQEFESAIKILTSQLKLHGISFGTTFSGIKDSEHVDLSYICGITGNTGLSFHGLSAIMGQLSKATEVKSANILALAESLHRRWENVPAALVVAEDPFIADPMASSTSRYFISAHDILTGHLRKIAEDNNTNSSIKIIRIPALQRYSADTNKTIPHSANKRDALKKYVANLSPEQVQDIASDPFDVAKKKTPDQVASDLEATSLTSPQGKATTVFDDDFPITFASSGNARPPEVLFLSGNPQAVFHQEGSSIIGIRDMSDANLRALLSAPYMSQGQKPRTVVITRSQLRIMHSNQNAAEAAQKLVKDHPHVKFIFVGQFQQGIRFSDPNRVCVVRSHSPTIPAPDNAALEYQIQENISHGIISGTSADVSSSIPRIMSSEVSNEDITSSFDESMKKRVQKPYFYDSSSGAKISWQDRFLPSTNSGSGIGFNDGNECVVSLFAPWVNATSGASAGTYQPPSGSADTRRSGQPIPAVTGFNITRLSPQYGPMRQDTWGSSAQVMQRQQVLAGNMQRALSTIGIVGDVIANGAEAGFANDMMLSGKKLIVMKSAAEPSRARLGTVRDVTGRAETRRQPWAEGRSLYAVNPRSGNWALLNNQIALRTKSAQLPTLLSGNQIYRPTIEGRSERSDPSWRALYQYSLPGSFPDHTDSYQDRRENAPATRDRAQQISSWSELSDWSDENPDGRDGLITQAAPAGISQWGSSRDTEMLAALKASERGPVQSMGISSAHFPGLRVHVDYRHGVMPPTNGTSVTAPLSPIQSHALLKLYKTNDNEWNQGIPLMSIPVHMNTPFEQNPLNDASFHYRIFDRMITDMGVRMISAYAARKFLHLSNSNNPEQVRQQEEVFPRGEWPGAQSTQTTASAEPLIYDDSIIEDPNSRDLKEMMLESYDKKVDSLKALYKSLIPMIFREYSPVQPALVDRGVHQQGVNPHLIPVPARPSGIVNLDGTDEIDALQLLPYLAGMIQGHMGVAFLYDAYARTDAGKSDIAKCVDLPKVREENIWGMDDTGKISAIFTYDPLSMKTLSEWHEECAAKLESQTGYREKTSSVQNKLEDIARFEHAVRIAKEDTVDKNLYENYDQLGRAQWGNRFSSRGDKNRDTLEGYSEKTRNFVDFYKKRDAILHPDDKPNPGVPGQAGLQTLSERIDLRDQLSRAVPLASFNFPEPSGGPSLEPPSQPMALDDDDMTNPAVVYADTVEKIDESIKDLLTRLEKVQGSETHHEIKFGMDEDGKYVELPSGTSRLKQRQAGRLLDHMEEIIAYLKYLQEKNSKLLNKSISRKVGLNFYRSLSFLVSANNKMKKHLYFTKGR